MLSMAIDLLWLLIYAIILCGVVYLVIYGIENFIQPIPELVKRGIWFIVLILVLIFVLMALGGGSGSVRSPFWR